MRFTTTAVAVLLLLLPLSPTFGAGKPTPDNREKCPVCGMFVARYPDFIATVTFRDGSSSSFDGPKDMFRYCLNVTRYTPARKAADISRIQVKDYYSLKPINGKDAYFVIGSDIYGPMGKELIPFATMAAAREFLKDHQGKEILRFHQVNLQLLQGLD